tara:strand:- start:22 stop:456 length:435 start_codon:yes stop_codon:yes gene_type:complete
MLSFLKDERTGRPKKIRVPGFIAIPIFKLLRSLTFLRSFGLDPLRFTSDRIRDLEHKKIFKEKLSEISKLNSGQKANKLRELVEISNSVKGYGPVREKAFKKFRERIFGIEVKRVRLLKNLFEFTSRKTIMASKIKKSNRNLNK